MTLKHLNFTKCLVAGAAAACFLSSGDEWALAALCGMYLAYEATQTIMEDRQTSRTQNLADIANRVAAFDSDLRKVQDHVKNLSLSKLNRS